MRPHCLFQEPTRSFECPAHPHAGGVFGDTQARAHFPQRLALVKAREDQAAIGLAQAVEGGVEVGGRRGPGIRMVHGPSMHESGLPFMNPTAMFRAQCFRSLVAGRTVQPAGQFRLF